MTNQKQNKGKAKRLAKEAAKGAKASSKVKVIMPIQQPGTNLVGVLKPAFARRNEPRDIHDKMSLALTRLRLHVGDEQDLPLLYSRLTFGRRVAHYHFTDDVAETLHHAVQTIVLAYQKQHPPGVVYVPTPKTYLDPEDADEISTALNAIEEMVGKVEHHEYEILALKHATQELEPVDHLQSWEDYLAKIEL